MDQKQWELYLPTTEFSEILKSGTKEVQYWVSKLSQKLFLKVKNGMKSDNNYRSHVNKSLHLGLCSLGILHSHITDSKFQVAGSNQ